MSEHIKTGGQIRKEIKKASFLKDSSLYLSKNSKQWVSLSWMKEQIENKIGFLKVGCANKEDKIIQLQWVLSLLE